MTANQITEPAPTQDAATHDDAIAAAIAIADAIALVHAAFGSPGDYGYGTRKGNALYTLYRARTHITTIRSALGSAAKGTPND